MAFYILLFEFTIETMYEHLSFEFYSKTKINK